MTAFYFIFESPPFARYTAMNAVEMERSVEALSSSIVKVFPEISPRDVESTSTASLLTSMSTDVNSRSKTIGKFLCCLMRYLRVESMARNNTKISDITDCHSSGYITRMLWCDLFQQFNFASIEILFLCNLPCKYSKFKNSDGTRKYFKQHSNSC